MNPDDFARRADDVIAGAAGDSAANDPTTVDRDPGARAGDGPAPAGDMSADETAELPLLRGERLAGRVLTRFVVSTGLLTALVAVCAAALAAVGFWEPLVAAGVLVVLSILSWRISVIVPTRALPVWSALLLLVISLGATTWAGLTHAEQILPRGEAGVNTLAAISLAEVHEWPVPLSANELGGPQTLRIRGVTIASPGFRQAGSAAEPVIEPEVLIGNPAWLSVGFWAGGVATLLWVPALFGGLAVLAIGLLTSSVVGPRWGPLGALSAALCFPVLHAARTTSADLMVVFVLSCGLILLVAATRAGARGHSQQARAVGFLAGTLVASGSLFRLDAVGPMLLLLPVAALMVIRRDGAGARVLWGAVAATGLSAGTAFGLSGALVVEQRGRVTPLAMIGLGLALAAVVMVLLAALGVRLPDGIRAVLPVAAATFVAICGLALLLLPSREALGWTSWWTGSYAMVITLGIVAAAAHHLARGWSVGERLPGWTGALAVGLGAACLHWLSASGDGAWGDEPTPWISGGLVVTVPLIIICATAATAWVTRWSTRHLPTVVAVVASVGTVGALLVPEVIATQPHARERVGQGQVAAVQQVCRAFGPGDVVLMVDDRAADEWPATVRANCDVPALSLTAATRHDRAARVSAVASVSKTVRAGGGRLVVMAATSQAGVSGSAGGSTKVGRPIAVVQGSVTQDAPAVSRRPEGLWSFPLQVWLAAVG